MIDENTYFEIVDDVIYTRPLRKDELDNIVNNMKTDVKIQSKMLAELEEFIEPVYIYQKLWLSVLHLVI